MKPNIDIINVILTSKKPVVVRVINDRLFTYQNLFEKYSDNKAWQRAFQSRQVAVWAPSYSDPLRVAPIGLSAEEFNHRDGHIHVRDSLDGIGYWNIPKELVRACCDLLPITKKSKLELYNET